MIAGVGINAPYSYYNSVFGISEKSSIGEKNTLPRNDTLGIVVFCNCKLLNRHLTPEIHFTAFSKTYSVLRRNTVNVIYKIVGNSYLRSESVLFDQQQHIM